MRFEPAKGKKGGKNENGFDSNSKKMKFQLKFEIDGEERERCEGLITCFQLKNERCERSERREGGREG